MTRIELAGVTRSFGRTRGLQPLELTHTGPGAIGVLGPNGSGKSTLLGLLGTVLSPSDGTLRIDGLDVRQAAERTEIRRHLGYLPQDAGLYRGFTAFDLVDYVAVLKEHTEATARRDEVRRALAAVDLEDRMHRKIRALSGGERRRVALAAALLGDPDLLVLDEPAAGLDPEQRLLLRDVVRERARRSLVVMATHHLDDVAAVCDRVLVLVEGALAFDGTPDDLAQLNAGEFATASIDEGYLAVVSGAAAWR